MRPRVSPVRSGKSLMTRDEFESLLIVTGLETTVTFGDQPISPCVAVTMKHSTPSSFI